MGLVRRQALFALAAFGTVGFGRASLAQGAPERISGTFADGTRWSATKPNPWNGTLLLDLDGAGFAGPPPAGAPGGGRPAAPPASSPWQDWLLGQGFAMGGTTREPIGYAFDKAVDNLVEVRELFTAKWSEPKRTLAVGGSRGAFVARKAMEYRPDIFAGALVSAGGGGGLIAGLHDRLNAVFTLKTLVDPAAPLTIVNVKDANAENAALTALLAKAMATPHGRARLSLAAAFEQFATWTSRTKPKPAPTDYDGQLDQIAEAWVFGNPPTVRAGVEKVAGGNVSWNTGIDYAALLRRSGRAPMVEALYRKAGASLADDLATLAKAPRIAADPAAVSKAEKLVGYTGKIKGPVVNVDNDDPVDAASYKLAYRDTLRKAGTEGLFRQIWVDGAGHGGQTPIDRAVAFRLLIRRLDTGAWGDTSVPALQAIAGEIAATTPSLGRSAIFTPPPIPAPLFTWDASNWNTYGRA